MGFATDAEPDCMTRECKARCAADTHCSAASLHADTRSGGHGCTLFSLPITKEADENLLSSRPASCRGVNDVCMVKTNAEADGRECTGST